MELLLLHGAEVNVLDNKGYTALDYTEWQDLSDISALRAHGAKSREELKEKQPGHTRHTLSWKNGEIDNSTITDVEFYLDGKSLGKGRSGFEDTLKQIAVFDDNSILLIQTKLVLSTGSKPLTPYPYQLSQELQDQFEKLIETKRIILEFGFQ